MLVEAAVEVAFAIDDDADGAVGVAGIAEVLGLSEFPPAGVLLAAAEDDMGGAIVEGDVLDVLYCGEGVFAEDDGVDGILCPAF